MNTHQEEKNKIPFIYILTGIISFSILIVYPLSMLLAAILQAKFQG